MYQASRPNKQKAPRGMALNQYIPITTKKSMVASQAYHRRIRYEDTRGNNFNGLAYGYSRLTLITPNGRFLNWVDVPKIKIDAECLGLYLNSLIKADQESRMTKLLKAIKNFFKKDQ